MKGNNKVILKKEEGIVKEVHDIPKFVDKEGRLKPHLCAEDCKNAGPLTCSKFADIRIKDISEYDQITEGVSIQEDRKNDDGKIVKEVTKLRVTACEDYERSNPKEVDSKRRRELVASLYTGYYGEATIEEAIRKHECIIGRQITRELKKR